MSDFYSFTTEYGKADEFFQAVLSLDKARVEQLKASGVTLTENVKHTLVNGGGSMVSNKPASPFWYLYLSDLENVEKADFAWISRTFFEETGAPLYFSDSLEHVIAKYFFNKEVFTCLLECYDLKKLNKTRTMKELVRKNNIELLGLCIKHGWLKQAKKRDEMINYANEQNRPECTAFLLEFKNNTADLAAERAKAEKKAERELNAAPDSALELKKLWSWKKQEDGTLIITSYKGYENLDANAQVTVPSKIGSNIVTAIADYALSPIAPKLKEQYTARRICIKKITVPSGIRTVGECAFGGSGTNSQWRSATSLLEEVVLPETLDIFTDRQAAENAPNVLSFKCGVAAVVPKTENARFYCIKNIINYRFAGESEVHIPQDEVIASDALYAAIIAGDKEKVTELKKNGAALTDYIKDCLLNEKNYADVLYGVQRDFLDMIFKTEAENKEFILSSLKAETGAPLYYSRYGYSRNTLPPELFDFLLEYFNTKFLDRIGEMRQFILDDRTEHLAVCAKHGWLKNSATRDKLIVFASEKNKTEATAWLLDFKNRTADLAAERKLAEKKAERELNADPNSLSEIKKVWKFEKRESADSTSTQGRQQSNPGGTVVVTGYKGDSTEVIVPEKICGDTVTAIGEYAFSPNAERLRKEQRALREAITKVTLPDTIESIGEFAFCKCKSLTEINFPKKLTKISKGMFEYTGFENIVIEGHVKRIGSAAFYVCRDLKHVKLCEGVAEIGSGAFYNCTELETIELPRSLERVPSNVMPNAPFWKCHKLTALVHKGSYAETYCKENNIAYKYKDEE